MKSLFKVALQSELPQGQEIRKNQEKLKKYQKSGKMGVFEKKSGKVRIFDKVKKKVWFCQFKFTKFLIFLSLQMVKN